MALAFFCRLFAFSHISERFIGLYVVYVPPCTFIVFCTFIVRSTVPFFQISMDAFEYLQSIGDSSIDLLYRDPWTCQAVFQSLPPVGKQFVVRLLCIDTPIATSVLWAWLTPKTNAANIQKTLLNNTITKVYIIIIILLDFISIRIDDFSWLLCV